MKLGNWNIEYEELFKFSEDLSKKFDLNHDDICSTTNVDGLKYSRSLRAKKLGNIFNYLKIYENKKITVYHSSSPISLNFDEDKIIKSIIIKNSITQKNTKLFLNNSLIFCAGGLGNPNLLQNLLTNKQKLIYDCMDDVLEFEVLKEQQDELENIENKLFQNADLILFSSKELKSRKVENALDGHFFWS